MKLVWTQIMIIDNKQIEDTYIKCTTHLIWSHCFQTFLLLQFSSLNLLQMICFHLFYFISYFSDHVGFSFFNKISLPTTFEHA